MPMLYPIVPDVVFPINSPESSNPKSGNYRLLDLMLNHIVLTAATEKPAVLNEVNFIIDVLEKENRKFFYVDENGDYKEIQPDSLEGKEYLRDQIIQLSKLHESSQPKRLPVIPNEKDVFINTIGCSLIGNHSLSQQIDAIIDDYNSSDSTWQALGSFEIKELSEEYYKFSSSEGIRFLEQSDGQYFETSDEKAKNLIENLFFQKNRDNHAKLDNMLASLFETAQNTSDKDKSVNELLEQLRQEVENAKPSKTDGRQRLRELVKKYCGVYHNTSKNSIYRIKLIDSMINLLKKEDRSLNSKKSENLLDDNNSRKLRKCICNLLRKETEKQYNTTGFQQSPDTKKRGGVQAGRR